MSQLICLDHLQVDKQQIVRLLANAAQQLHT